jgi:hypothetical protein
MLKLQNLFSFFVIPEAGMYYLAILVVFIIIVLFLFFRFGKSAFSMSETYEDPNAPMTRCRHCDTVITTKNHSQHGVNCAQRPADYNPAQQ